MNRNEEFKYYIEKVYEPAMHFIDSQEGQKFVHDNFPAYEKYIFNERKTDTYCCYIIRFKGTAIYIGEARRAWGRIAVHIARMYDNPIGYFGLAPNELKYVSFELDKKTIRDPGYRRRHELDLRRRLNPTLNPVMLGDGCITKKMRYDAVHGLGNYTVSDDAGDSAWFLDAKRIKEAICFITQYYPCFSFITFLRKKTPCCDYSSMEIPDGLEKAVGSYINGLSREEYKKLNSLVSLELGEGFYVTKSTLIKLFSRILADGNQKQIKDTLKAALEMQIKQRNDLLINLSGT